MLARILAHHFKKTEGTGEPLLTPNWGAYTSDTYDAPQRDYRKLPISHLTLGWVDGNSVDVSHLVSGNQRGFAEVFAVGVPEATSSPQNPT